MTRVDWHPTSPTQTYLHPLKDHRDALADADAPTSVLLSGITPPSRVTVPVYAREDATPKKIATGGARSRKLAPLVETANANLTLFANMRTLISGGYVMPKVDLVFFRESDGTVPLIEWLDRLQPKARAKCRAWLRQLRDQGNELRRPIADYLRDGIYELRVGLQGTNYRILYFFHGREVVVVSHGLIKERVVPPKEIEKAIYRLHEYSKRPTQHTYVEEE